MLRFNDVILARPVPLEHEGAVEVKDRESMVSACQKLDTLPIYYGLKHDEVDARGGVGDVIGRARHLRYDPGRDGVVGDVELDVLPEALARLGKVGYSMWYATNKEGNLLKDIMWKHVLATASPLDEALVTRLDEGFMVGESRELAPPPAPDAAAVKTVPAPPVASEPIMPDEELTPSAEAKEPKPAAKAAPTPPEPPADYTEARQELIAEYRERLKGKLPDAALKSLTLKSLRETYNEIKAQEAEHQKQKEPEHPSEERRGLPAPPPSSGPDLIPLSTTKGDYVTIPGFVEKLQAKHEAEFPREAPFVPLTGPVSSYSNIAPVSAAERQRLSREARTK